MIDSSWAIAAPSTPGERYFRSFAGPIITNHANEQEAGAHSCGLSGRAYASSEKYGAPFGGEFSPAQIYRHKCFDLNTGDIEPGGSHIERFACPTASGGFGNPDSVTGLCQTTAASVKENAGESECPADNRAGNPVNLLTGKKYQKEVDVAYTKSPLAQLVRHFNQESDGLENWSFGYHSTIVTNFLDQRFVTYRDSDGTAHIVDTLNNQTDTAGLSIAVTADANGNATAYTVTRPDGVIEYFNGLYLQLVQTPSGDSLTYSKTGSTETITSNRGDIIFIEDKTYDASTNTFAQSVSVNGLVTEYIYDFSYSLEKVIYADGSVRQYQYEGDNLVGIIDENNNNEAIWQYDSEDRVIFNSHAGGTDTFEFEYTNYGIGDASGSVRVTNPLGRNTVYQYQRFNGRRKMVSVVGELSDNCSSYSRSSAFDVNGNPISRTDQRGNVTTYVRDALGRVVSRTEAAGTAQARTITTTWSDANLVTSVTHPLYTQNYTYDASGFMQTSAMTDSASGQTRTTTYTRDGNGRITSVNGPRTDVNDITTITYHACAAGGRCGQVATITNAAGHVVTISDYNEFAQPTTIIDAVGIQTTLAYDLRQRLISASTAGSTVQITYDAVGNLLRTTYSDGVYIENAYDTANRLLSVTDSEGNRVSWQLDNAGNRTNESITDPQNQLRKNQQMAYDEISRLISMTYAHGGTDQYTYDGNNNLTRQKDAANRETLNGFDALDRLVTTQDAIQGQTVLAYNSRDDLTQVTDPEGKTTTYTYNGFGEQRTVDSPDTGLSSYTYDAAGNRVSSADARGITATYAFDALNRLSSVNYPNAAENITYTYDSAANGVGRLARINDQTGSVSFSYDPRGNVAQVVQTTSGNSYTTSYQYNAADRPIGMTNPSGRQIDYGYDASGRVNSVTSTHDGVAENLATNITRLPYGPTTSMTLGNGIPSSKDFDLDYRVVGINHGSVLQRNYAHSSVNNITAITDSLNAAQSQLFDYDALDRLSFATGGYGEQSFTYDGIGNRLSLETISDGNTDTQNYQYDANSHRLSAIAGERTFSYDAVGNTTNNGKAAFTYNNRNRMDSATANGVTTSYEINALGQRVRKSSSVGETQFIYDLSGRLIAEADVGGVVLVEYAYLDGEPLAMWREAEEPEEPAGENVAPAGSSAQSSTAFGGVVGRATDGDTNGVFNQGSVTHTNNESQPWWETALAERTLVNRVVLYNRTDCCTTRLKDVHVFVSEEPFGEQTLTELLARDDIAHTYLSGVQGAVTEVSITGAGSYVRVQLAGTGVLSLAEVQIYGDVNPTPTGTNLALTATADQSSTRAAGGAAGRAIDGDTNGEFNQGSVTHTNTESQPWWEVALAERSTISSVVLFNRINCCLERLSDVHVFVSEQAFGDQTLAELLARNDIAHTYFPGVQGAQTQVPITGIGSYVRVQLAGTGVLSLAEVQIYGEVNTAPPETNLALTATADQSSTRAAGGAAGRAIDGDTNGVFNQGSVTHTNSQSQPWWEVALAERSTINSMVLFNRINCCLERLSDVHVFVSEQAFGEQSLAELLARNDIAHTYLPGVQGAQTQVPITGTGSYVRVQLAGSGVLSLAEVQIFGEVSLAPPETNLALAGTADQSSTRAAGGAAGRAIDGDTNGVFNQGSVTHTNSQSQPWWEVALAERSTISSMVLFNRINCCLERLSDVHVFVSEQAFGEQSLAELLARNDIAHTYLPGVQGAQTQVPITGTGSYVRVQLAGSGVLSLAEVQINGFANPDTPTGNTLLQNGGFESGLNSWLSCSDSGASQTVADPTQGSQALQVTGNDCLYQEFAVMPNSSYTVQCDAKATAYASISLSVMDASFNQVGVEELSIESASYQSYSASIVAPTAGAIGAVTFYSEGTGKYDACSVVEGQ